ncbi:DUF2782 domain-containing protein [Arenimonas daejeonensis]|uniref:DUF2782 domain-containing protein n=1 Tax=Arenimonas daejeonensis TaxID=370777 RepID=UPI001D156EF9|nr:DUF2782 domain-containing protein [Arenimonas daejeonensis]
MSPMLPLLLALAVQDADTAKADDVPIPEKVQAEAVQDEPPTVAIRVEQNGDRVEEYRQNGVLYMVKITPERGPAYYLHDTDGNGRFNRHDSLPKVSPVYWTVYEWD